MNKNFFFKLAEEVKKNNNISEDMFDFYNVKRGLRNKDGSGVLVGLTEISSVLGYRKEDQEVVPVEGELFYRGYPITELADSIGEEDGFGFEKIVYLLLTGSLPNKTELKNFQNMIKEQRELPKNFVRDELSTFRTTDLMNALSTSVLTMYATDPEPDRIDITSLLYQGISIIAKLPSIVAYSYRVYLDHFKEKSLILHRHDNKYLTAENFLNLIRDDSRFTKLEAKVLDLALLLHADHGGGNNSTFTVRVCSSSHTDSYSAIAAGIGSLKGPLHGGANLYVINMMEDIKANIKDWGNEKEIRAYLLKILEKKAGLKDGKIYGFGHAVYTLSDPRAKILKKYAKKLAKEKNRQEEFELYEIIARIVPDVFKEFKGKDVIISPNVDYYSGFVYECLNIPKEVYTPMFAMARVAGWVAHRIEELLVQKRIIRPAFKSVTKPRPLRKAKK